FDAAGFPRAPSLAPVSQRGGGNPKVPPTGLVLGIKFGRALIETPAALPVSSVFLQQSQVVIRDAPGGIEQRCQLVIPLGPADGALVRRSASALIEPGCNFPRGLRIEAHCRELDTYILDITKEAAGGGAGSRT